MYLKSDFMICPVCLYFSIIQKPDQYSGLNRYLRVIVNLPIVNMKAEPIGPFGPMFLFSGQFALVDI